jgi:hypothetical protein
LSYQVEGTVNIVFCGTHQADQSPNHSNDVFYARIILAKYRIYGVSDGRFTVITDCDNANLLHQSSQIKNRRPHQSSLQRLYPSLLV